VSRKPKCLGRKAKSAVCRVRTQHEYCLRNVYMCVCHSTHRRIRTLITSKPCVRTVCMRLHLRQFPLIIAGSRTSNCPAAYRGAAYCPLQIYRRHFLDRETATAVIERLDSGWVRECWGQASILPAGRQAVTACFDFPPAVASVYLLQYSRTSILSELAPGNVRYSHKLQLIVLATRPTTPCLYSRA
jgi:hypothetical protein